MFSFIGVDRAVVCVLIKTTVLSTAGESNPSLKVFSPCMDGEVSIALTGSLGSPYLSLTQPSHIDVSISLYHISHHGPESACCDISCVYVFVYLLKFG